MQLRRRAPTFVSPKRGGAQYFGDGHHKTSARKIVPFFVAVRANQEFRLFGRLLEAQVRRPPANGTRRHWDRLL